MRWRAWFVAAAAALVLVASAVSALAQFGWGYPNYYQPSQPYYPNNPWYAPRGAPEYVQPRRRSRTQVRPPQSRSYAEPRRPSRIKVAPPRARVARPRPQPDAKPEVTYVEPAMHVAVFGDQLAESVADGLEAAFEDVDDILVVQDTKTEGAIARPGQDWPKIIQDFLEEDKKVAFVVLMFGANERQPIEEAEVSHEPFSGRWTELYRHRLEAVFRILNERRVPFVWVGAPPMKDDRFSADVLSLNERVRAAVQSAGGAFVDIWAGFVDDKNAYVASGPDVDGKVTRLRASNGVNFTEAGGRKAAHFAEAELKRLIAARAGTSTANPAPGTPGTEAATPAEGVASASVPSGPPKPKPVEGPVLPLTNPPLKAPGATLATGSIPLEGDPVVSRALRDGIAPPARPGRADEFRWPVR
jgi:uncharacterized protein